jgi:hypothetical protein
MWTYKTQRAGAEFLDDERADQSGSSCMTIVLWAAMLIG